jgi:thiol-disulfide isomerase/thioredoxin
MKIKILTFLAVLYHCIIVAQSSLDINSFDINYSKGSNKMYSLTASDLKCLAQKANKKLLVYVYEYWCKPCNEKIIKVKKFSEDNNLNFIVLTLEKEGSKESKKDEKILTEKYEIEHFGVLSDSYGNTMRKKYKTFLSEIEDDFDISGLSKWILLNESGDFIYKSRIEDKEDDEINKYLTSSK